ncbi:MAG: hypothetical protein EYC70_05555 [Planctomycetota bacterium]|nr:MAG: hypothetical protein EYC70_05555 [Planctomycetota bacterium]
MLQRLVLLLCSCLALGLPADAARSSARPCARGAMNGAWNLPHPLASDGFIDGRLFDANGNSVFALRATLTDVVSPCLSCIEGTIQGTLDDGVGTTPDYLVYGNYRGNFLARQGSFTALLYPYGSRTPTGKLNGAFRDPYSNPDVPGQFRGDWVVCR